MKPLLPYFISLFLIGVFTIGAKPHVMQHIKVKEIPAKFEGDSGYILKQQGIDLLVQVSGTDTIDITGGNRKSTDTIGKYYKANTGNYMVCVLDIIHPNENAKPVVFEITDEGKVLDSESFSEGMYLCCWDDNYSGFKKYGDYFSVKVCGTGSGYCSGEIYLFKTLSSYSSGTIMQTAWCTWCRQPLLACNLTSKMEIRADTVVMHYNLRLLKRRRKDYKLKDTEVFDIKYIEKDSNWVALDTTNISKLPF